MERTRTEPTTSPAGVRRLEFAVDWPPGHVAAYLIPGEEPILVDTGMADGREALVDGLDALGYDPADVEHLLVTHPHVDHIGNVTDVLEAGDPTVYAPAGVRKRFARDVDALGERVRANARELGVRDDYLEEAVDMAVRSLERDRELLPSEAVDVILAGGDGVTVGGFEVEVVHTPGHQAEHLCYAAEVGGERVLLSGDMAIREFRSVALHDGLDDGYTEAIDAFYDGLDRLGELDVDRVFPGHGPVHEEFDAAVADSVDSLDRLLDDLEARVQDDAATALEVALERTDERRDIGYMLPEVASGLAALESRDRVGSTLEDGLRRYEST